MIQALRGKFVAINIAYESDAHTIGYAVQFIDAFVAIDIKVLSYPRRADLHTFASYVYDPPYFKTGSSPLFDEAVRIAGVSDDTLRRWTAIHHLGRRIGGRWFVSRLALAMYLDGDKAALRELLAGNRDAPEVRPYVLAVENTKKPAAKTAKTAETANAA